MGSKEKCKTLKLAIIAKTLFILLTIFSAFGIASADPIMSSLLAYNNQAYKVKSETIRVVTAYNVGAPLVFSACLKASMSSW